MIRAMVAGWIAGLLAAYFIIFGDIDGWLGAGIALTLSVAVTLLALPQ
jgi:hypothetical protein